MKTFYGQKVLAELFEFQNGRGFKKSEWKTKGIPIIRIQNLNNAQGSFNYFQGKYDKAIEINAGDLLFSWSGTVGSSFGSHLWQGPKGVLNQHIFKVNLKSGIDKHYAYYGLRYITEEVEKQVNGAVGLVHITKEKLNNFRLITPPLPEQKRIVAILDEAFAAISKAKANAEKNLRNAKELFESYLQGVFAPRLRSGQAPPGEGWEEKTLGEVCESLHQGLNTAGEKVKFSATGYPVIQTRNIDNSIVDITEKMKFVDKTVWKKYNQKYKPSIGDVFFTNIGTIGKTAIVTEDRDYLIHWNIFKLKPNQNKISSEFLKTTLDYLTRIGYFKSLQKGGTVDFVTKKMISEALVAIPPLGPQREVVRKLDELSSETIRLESIYQQKLAGLDELKKSVLQKAFRGEL